MVAKTRIWILPAMIAGLILLLPNGCKKEHVAIVPSLSTTPVNGIAQTIAASGGTITSDGGAAITARGVCWSTSATPTITDSKSTDGDGIGSFISTMTGLTPNTLYNIRAYASNSAGTAYGSAVAFTTLALPLPEVTTTAVTDIAASTATSGGNVTSDGGLAVTTRGVCWSTAATPTTADSKTVDGTGTGSFVSSLSGLTTGTTYNVRAYATSTAGTAYGVVVSFTTPQIPTVTTTAITSILVVAASGGGNVTSSGGVSVTGRGICWSTSASPTINDSKTTDGTGGGGFTSGLTSLLANTKYYVRAYATNLIGTAYGNEVSFTTFAVMDNDGNGYYSVVISTQEWMKSNLRTTTYSDGTAIQNVTDVTAWFTTSTGAYATYNNSSGNLTLYGALYNWYAVTDAHHLCPTGWHAPDDSEWDALANQLGGASTAGGKMKATGTIPAGTGLWDTPNTGATNESGFTGLPGGSIGDTSGGPPSHFTDMTGRGHWWSTTGSPSFVNWRYLSFNDSNLGSAGNFTQNGKSVRCIKN